MIDRPETTRRTTWGRFLSRRAVFILLASAAFAGISNGQQQALGSLNSAGDTFVDAMPVPAESTIFPGDVVRTGGNGNGTFTLTGKGSLKLAPQTQVKFAGDPRFLAELQSGRVVMDSFGGTTDLTVRAGNFVVSPLIGPEKSSSRIEEGSDGSFTIVCLDGSISVIPLEGATGRVLQANQMLTISSAGELGLVQQATATAATQPSPVPHAQKSRKGWIILGAAGAGGAIVAAAAASHGGNNQAVSPSSP
jgi:hypothetical protein